MNFCPLCGGLLQVVKKGAPSLRCPKCKYNKPLKQEEGKQKIGVHSGKSAEIVVIDKKAASLRQMPMVRIVCLTCGHKSQTRRSIQQLPSSDVQIVEQQEERLDEPNRKALSSRKSGLNTMSFYNSVLYVSKSQCLGL
jgi:DNA-directed RNA polymerase subunit M/transcription elongation factor TFIIS